MLLPDLDAGCSLADSITAPQLRRAGELEEATWAEALTTATRALGDDDPRATRALGDDDPRATRALEASVPVGGAAAGGGAAVDVEDEPYDAAATEEPARDRRRDWLIGLAGVIGGLVLALLVAWFAGGGDDDDLGDLAGDERLAALEADREELQAQNADLEAQLADAQAAAAGADADLDAQRAALDERSTSLDQRAAALDDREAALDDREAALADREQQVDQAPDGDGGGDRGGGIEMPDLPDAEEVEGFFSQLMDRLTSLFD